MIDSVGELHGGQCYGLTENRPFAQTSTFGKDPARSTSNVTDCPWWCVSVSINQVSELSLSEDQ